LEHDLAQTQEELDSSNAVSLEYLERATKLKEELQLAQNNDSIDVVVVMKQLWWWW
jgi:hypothetical protein